MFRPSSYLVYLIAVVSLLAGGSRSANAGGDWSKIKSTTPVVVEDCSPELDAAARLARTLRSLGPGATDPKRSNNMALNGALMAVDKDGNCVSVRRAATPELVNKLRAISHSNGGRGRTIFYVNGIRTDWQGHCKTLKAIGSATCAKVIGIYNATNGMVRDLGECTADTKNVWRAKLRLSWGSSTDYIGDNPAVKRLAHLIVSELRNNRSPELFAHSQGGLISSLAIAHARNTLGAAGVYKLGRIRVTSFASAAPWWPSGPRYRHFIHTNDMVPVNLGLGRTGNYENAGRGARIYRFNGEPGEFKALPDGKWASIPYPTSYHDMHDVYLRYFKEVVGDCGGGKP